MEFEWGPDTEYPGELNLWENGNILGWLDLNNPTKITWHDIRGIVEKTTVLGEMSEDEAVSVAEAMVALEGRYES